MEVLTGRATTIGRNIACGNFAKAMAAAIQCRIVSERLDAVVTTGNLVLSSMSKLWTQFHSTSFSRLIAPGALALAARAMISIVCSNRCRAQPRRHDSSRRWL